MNILSWKRQLHLESLIQIDNNISNKSEPVCVIVSMVIGGMRLFHYIGYS